MAIADVTRAGVELIKTTKHDGLNANRTSSEGLVYNIVLARPRCVRGIISFMLHPLQHVNGCWVDVIPVPDPGTDPGLIDVAPETYRLRLSGHRTSGGEPVAANR